MKPPWLKSFAAQPRQISSPSKLPTNNVIFEVLVNLVQNKSNDHLHAVFGHPVAADIEKRFTGGLQMFLISILEVWNCRFWTSSPWWNLWIFQEPHSLDHKVPYDVDPELQAISNSNIIYYWITVVKSVMQQGNMLRNELPIWLTACTSRLKDWEPRIECSSAS